jgi:DNA polymerase III alpha subunit
MWTENNTEAELIEGVMLHGPDILDHCITSDSIEKYFDQLSVEHLLYPTPKKQIDSTRWFIPREYQEMDIEAYVVQNSPKENYERVMQELQLFQQNNMIPVLKTMKYVVDTLRKNNVIWGVGRGSSVASYVLYLIGVHKVDSLYYDLPIDEFLKEDK